MTDKDIEVIVKPIFTKMFKANFSACEYGIECYKKGMEYQGIKELATENDNLIKQVEKLENKNVELLGEIAFTKNALNNAKAQIEGMSELINRYYEECAQIPKELRTMAFDSCLEDTRKMVKDKKIKIK